MKRILPVLFSVFCFLFSVFPVFAQDKTSGLFDPGWIVNSLFGGIRKNWDRFFGGNVPEQGGAIIPIVISPQPSPTPGGPPSPLAGDFIRLSLEWDALSVGPETVAVAEKDPLEDEHKSKIACCTIQGDGYEEPCAVANIRHALWGWCGQTPTTRPSPPPDKVPIESPGPNRYTLPFAISNKYLRRDGYLFDCVPQECIADENNCPDLITRDNYLEFQTEIYHSNDFSYWLRVDNLSDHKVENVNIEAFNLTYSANDRSYSLPHNADYPLQVISTTWPPIVRFGHGNNLPPFEKIVEAVKFSNLPPIKIGSFDLAKGESKTFPLQDERAARNRIPSSIEDPDTCGSGGGSPIGPTPIAPTPAPPAPDKPCVCRAVRIHYGDPKECEVALCDDSSRCSRKPTIEECRQYYGLLGGVPNNPRDAAGRVCDKQCVQVDGCPPPSCFTGSQCSSGPKPGSSECRNWGTAAEIPRQGDLMDNLSLESLWQTVEKLILPSETRASGCPTACVDPPRLGTKGQGSIVPRDFENITNNSTSPSCKEREFKDITGSGGCGYNASSNNSIVGPLLFTATYGKTSPSRSVLLASLPIGGRIIDDEGRPFGWPTTGQISQNWGNTGQAQSQGPYRSTPGQLYSDYISCPGQGATYPRDGRPRAGDWLHPGIDIKPVGSQSKPSEVYSTQAGWVTFAGLDPSRPEKGWTVQIESDTNQDNKPDFATRYEHLAPGSLQFDVQWKKRKFSGSSKPVPFGTGVYVARNQLIGRIGDSGSPGVQQLHYEILKNLDLAQSGKIAYDTCKDDPYVLACLMENVESFFFAKERFEPDKVKGPIYSNPGAGWTPTKPPGSCKALGEFQRVLAQTGSCNSRVAFSWTPSANATHYEIDYQPRCSLDNPVACDQDNDNDATWYKVDAGGGTNLTQDVTYRGVAFNADFWWRVLAMNDCGDQKRAQGSASSPNRAPFSDRGEFRVGCP